MMEIENIDEHDVEVQCIDLFTLRILSLLICRGKPNEKANFLLALGDLE